ncbi:YuzD family protein [Aquibacillus koreensis]|uniref:YuzD family protein n=1 Tax=Aquibacillus koreensis TaxID=279446 RepID=A0A9X3WL91_9BACI|nr:YuzD family protein [Aquibacillus koreensis]MCT2535880.1 YuzD family protein [Aquibacillus koreensis]MDC3420336.1 YuzD family protein [Aquibacillus koreensis]
MTQPKVNITVYGADRICASCVNAPGSKDTYEWLQAAVFRKFNKNKFEFVYVDIDQPATSQKHEKYIEQLESDALFYPLIVIDDEVVGEGIPTIKPIMQVIESKVTL